MHKSWIHIILKTYDVMEDEKTKKLKVKKMIRKLLQRADTICPPIDFDVYEPAHCFNYLLALQNSDEKRFRASTYNARYLQHCIIYAHYMVRNKVKNLKKTYSRFIIKEDN